MATTVEACLDSLPEAALAGLLHCEDVHSQPQSLAQQRLEKEVTEQPSVRKATLLPLPHGSAGCLPLSLTGAFIKLFETDGLTE